MKAARYSRYGEADVIEIDTDTPTPDPKEGQVLVSVYASSINPFDYKLRRGYMEKVIPLELPVTLGGDFSGVITKVDSAGESDFKIGDAVYGSALLTNGGSGSLAEFAVARVKNIAPKPKNLTHLEVASLPLVGTSAVQAIEEHLQVKKGDRILIHGGSGGIGSIAIQLAKYHGAYVITTVSEGGVDFVRSLGADEAIEYKKQKFEEVLSDLDGVFDTTGGDVVNTSLQVLKKGGILVSMGGQPDLDEAKKRGVTALRQNTGVSAERLTRLSTLISEGAVHPQVDMVFPLVKTKDAFEHLENEHPKGKVVVTIREE